jgi:pyruvate kinase
MPDDRNVRIMGIMPSVAASDPNLVRDFLNRGMSIMRINCAHDSADEWLRMVESLQAAEEETGKTCKIAFDFAGPKLRTGPLSRSTGIIRWKPVRNQLGQVTTRASVAFCNDNYSCEGETVAIPVLGSIFRHARAGDIVELTDTRGRERTLHVVEVDE